MKSVVKRINPRIGLALLLLELALWFGFNPQSTCQAQFDCKETAVAGVQPYPDQLAGSFESAGLNMLANQGPGMVQIYQGYPEPKKISPYVPCILLKAIGYTESNWKQYETAEGAPLIYGEAGVTNISFDCGYGIMQITTGMNGRPTATADPKFDSQRVAAEPAYNISTGALFLINKWNKAPYIGENNPYIVEDWYFAVWAYNGWGWVNNPNKNCPTDNPICSSGFNPFRPPYDGSTTPRSWYPYQELVWGFAAHPPKFNNQPFWTAQELTLPDRKVMATPIPTWVPRSDPAHVSCALNQTYLSLVSNEATPLSPQTETTPIPPESTAVP
jgi:hypothetical protein